MKIGDKIIARIQALNVKNKKYITYGKEYTITNQSGSDFAIIDDLGNTKYYPPNEFNQFFKLPEPNWLTKKEATTPSHYDNTNGSLYLFAEQHKLNAWEADIIKRVVRCRKKGSFIEDLEKTKFLIDLYIKEYDEKK